MAVESEEVGKAQLVQHPVYYVSKVLTPCKTRYPHYEKITYGMFMAARKLRHYSRRTPSQLSVMLRYQTSSTTKTQ